MGLSDGERIAMMRSAVLVDLQITRLSDGQTELAWHIRGYYALGL